jgi:hypothetical protein
LLESNVRGSKRALHIYSRNSSAAIFFTLSLFSLAIVRIKMFSRRIFQSRFLNDELYASSLDSRLATTTEAV